MTPDELEAQMCGQVKIDLDDWKNSTEYRDFMMSGKLSWTIRWFWQVMETYSQQQLARILMFCTGSSRLPLGGFADLESQSG
jgi:HECT-domain (ubiquitin-transferase)